MRLIVVREQEEAGRPPMPMVTDIKRLSNFDIVELGYAREAAEEESGRCLRCDLEDAGKTAEPLQESSTKGG